MHIIKDWFIFKLTIKKEGYIYIYFYIFLKKNI